MSSRTSNHAQHDSSPTVAPFEQVARFSLTAAPWTAEMERAREIAATSCLKAMAVRLTVGEDECLGERRSICPRLYTFLSAPFGAWAASLTHPVRALDGLYQPITEMCIAAIELTSCTTDENIQFLRVRDRGKGLGIGSVHSSDVLDRMGIPVHEHGGRLSDDARHPNPWFCSMKRMDAPRVVWRQTIV